MLAEMRILRFLPGKIRQDKIENTEIRRRLGVEGVEKKLCENWLRWFGHAERREDKRVGRGIQRWFGHEERKEDNHVGRGV